MSDDDLYRACAEACLAVIGYIPGTDAYTALAAYRSGRPEFRAAIDLAVRAGRERADESALRYYNQGFTAGYAEGRRDGAEERATGGICGTALPGSPQVVCSLLAEHPGWHHASNGCDFMLHGPAAPTQTAASGTTPPGEGDPVGAGASGAQRAAQAVVDVNICRRSERVDDPTAHSWRFDGDDPRIVCVYCGQERDSQTGRVIRDGAR